MAPRAVGALAGMPREIDAAIGPLKREGDPHVRLVAREDDQPGRVSVGREFEPVMRDPGPARALDSERLHHEQIGRVLAIGGDSLARRGVQSRRSPGAVGVVARLRALAVRSRQQIGQAWDDYRQGVSIHRASTWYVVVNCAAEMGTKLTTYGTRSPGCTICCGGKTKRYVLPTGSRTVEEPDDPLDADGAAGADVGELAAKLAGHSSEPPRTAGT